MGWDYPRSLGHSQGPNLPACAWAKCGDAGGWHLPPGVGAEHNQTASPANPASCSCQTPRPALDPQICHSTSTPTSQNSTDLLGTACLEPHHSTP